MRISGLKNRHRGGQKCTFRHVRGGPFFKFFGLFYKFQLRKQQKTAFFINFAQNYPPLKNVFFFTFFMKFCIFKNFWPIFRQKRVFRPFQLVYRIFQLFTFLKHFRLKNFSCENRNSPSIFTSKNSVFKKWKFLSFFRAKKSANYI